MIAGMYISTMGAMVEQAKHETVANNLANHETAGFKPDFANFMQIPAESIWKGLGRREADMILEQSGGGVWMDSTTTDFTAGPAKTSNNPLDMMLKDDPGRISFFKVRVGEGEADIRYTRNGSFLRDAAGTLVTDGGHPVLNTANQPIVIPGNGEIEVKENGQITLRVGNEPEQLLGQIGVASTTLEEAQKGLKKLGDSFFVPKEGTVIEDSEGKVMSCAVEGSASDGIKEMVAMIEGHRAYELNMKFLSMQDKTLGTAIQSLTGA